MQVVQITHQNPQAREPLIVPVLILPNTPEEIGNAQIAANAALPLPWLDVAEPHDGVAIICGGGPSLARSTGAIRELVRAGGVVFGLNAAASFLVDEDIGVDWQVIVDPKRETAALVEPLAYAHVFASQVHPDTVAAAPSPVLFHLANIGIEDLLPPERVAEGGYALVGGGVSVGITALTTAYTMGFRRLHIFGYDSSNEDGETHAYPQPMNALIPSMEVEWSGRRFTASMPMKLQAEAFLRFAPALQEAGCTIDVHGDGLLPAMWRLPPATEREKYQLLWAGADYRAFSPGEGSVGRFLEIAQPAGLVVDFGCGSGRAATAIAAAGHEVLLVDFTDNCRDKAAMGLPFLQWDLTQPIPLRAPCGICADVMEHIPTADVPAVIANVMAAAERVFFQIATRPDQFGASIGQQLHLTVQPHEWWRAQFAAYDVTWEEDVPGQSSFYVSTLSDRTSHAA